MAGHGPDRELNMARQLLPIRDDVDYENAVAIADQLAVLDERTRDQEDDLETLCELIGKYDDRHYASSLDHLSPEQSLAYLLAENKMTLPQLGEILGEPISAVQQILAGECALTQTHICVLTRHFKVTPDLFDNGRNFRRIRLGGATTSLGRVR